MSIDAESTRLLNCLKISFSSSSDTTLINQAEKELAELAKERETHLKVLINCVTLNEQSCPLDLKKSVTIYLKNFLIKNLKEFDKNSLLKLFQFLIGLVLKKNECNVKQASLQSIIISTIEIMMKMSPSDAFRDVTFIQEILKFLFSFIPGDSTNPQYIPILKDVFTLINQFITQKFLNEDTVNLILSNVFELIDSTFKITQNFINPQTQNMNIEFIHILTLIFTLLTSICKKIKEFPLNYAINIFNKYSKFTLELISLDVMNKENDVVIYFTQNEKLNKIVNIMKSKALRFSASLIKIFIKRKMEQPDIQIPDYLSHILNIIKLINISLLNTIKFKMTIVQKSLMNEFDSLNTNKKEEENNSNGYNVLLFEMLYLLYVSVQSNEIKKQIGLNIKDFLLNYVFPLMTSTDDEIFQMQNEGEDYFRFITDMFEHRAIKHYRIESCVLLVKISQLYVDLPSFIFSLTFQMLEYILTKNSGGNQNLTPSDIQLAFPLYYEVKDKNYLIDLYNDEKKIDFCFIIILLLKDYLISNRIYKRTLYQILQSNLDRFNNIESVLIKQKLCLLYEIFTPILYNQNSIDCMNSVFKIVQFLYNQIMNTKYQSLSFQASQALLNLFSEQREQYEKVITTVMNQSIEGMIKNLNESDVNLFFDLLYETVKSIKIQDRIIAFELVKSLSSRLQADILRNSKVFILKCFNILIAFLKGKNEIDPNNKEELVKFQSLIIQIIGYIKNPSKIFFEDNIVNLADSYNTSTKAIVCEMNDTIIPNIPAIIKKDDSFSRTSFNYLINIVRLDKSLTYLQRYKAMLIDLCLHSFELEEEESMLHSLLLLMEIIFALPSDNLTKEEITRIAKNTHNITNNLGYDEGEEEDYFNNLLMKLNLTWVSLFCLLLTKNLPLSFEIFQENQLLIPFIEKVYGVLNIKFSNNILLKIIIIGLCHMLSNSEILTKIKEMKDNLPIGILTVLFYLVKKQKSEEVQKLKQKMKKEVDCNFVEENEEDEENELKDQTIKNYFKKHLEELDSDMDEDEDPLMNFGEPIKDNDEFLYFKQCIETLQNTKIFNLYENFIGKLSPNEIEYLNDVLHVRNVSVQYNNETLMIPRRTVKIKRRGQNNGPSP